MARPVTKVDKDQLLQLFADRDDAVFETNLPRFLATQIGEIPGASAQGYLSLHRIHSQLLHQSYLDDSETALVALVKESYWNTDDRHESPRTVFLLYYLAHIALASHQHAWAIYRLIQE